MKFKKLFTLLIVTCSFALITSCEIENEGKESNSEEDSHNVGNDCLLCHKDGGNGQGIFSVAGTIYDSTQTAVLSGSTVYLYTGPNATGTLLATIPTDGSGNFYTSAKLNLSNGVYAQVKASNGHIKEMGSKIMNGACSSCHGQTTDKIWVK